MKSLTIHGIDEPLAELIKSKALSEGLSMNKTIKKLLEESLGVKPSDSESRRDEFKGFCGKWSKAQAGRFNERTKALRQINDGDWQ